MNELRGVASSGPRKKQSAHWVRGLALLMVAVLMAIAAGTSAATDHHRRHHHHPKATPTPTPKPKPTPNIVIRPLVLVTGGTGTISVPTGDSPAVLDSAEVYDPASATFRSIAPM